MMFLRVLILAVELPQEAFERFVINELLFVLVNLVPQRVDLMLHLSELALDLLAPLSLGVSVLLLPRCLLLVVVDELPELLTVGMQVGLRGLQRFECAFLFRLKVVDLFDDGLMRQLDEEHVLLLVDELVDVLTLALAGELDTRLGNLGGGRDLTSLLGVEVVLGLRIRHGDDVLVFYAL